MTHAPPPYSCARVRTDSGFGVTSWGEPSAAWRTRTTRPASSGLPSSQYTSPSTISGAASETPPAAIKLAEIGDRQPPYGAASGIQQLYPNVRVRLSDLPALLTWPRNGYRCRGIGA